MKRCAFCKIHKDLESFNKNRSMRDGLSPYCRACDKARGIIYIRENPPKRGVESKSSLWFGKLKTLVIDGYGASCSCCREHRRPFLTLDHVHGGGGAHRRKDKIIHYKDARDRAFPPDYRVLCYNCNCSMAYKGYCPHQKDKAVQAA